MKNKFNLNELLGKPIFLFQKYHNKTKLKKTSKELESNDWPESWKKIYFKSYPRFNETILPKPNLKTEISLKKTLVTRSSNRNFSKNPLSTKQLSTLLYYSAGLKDSTNPNAGRFYPSAGARYPLEVYVLSTNSELPNGLYHYYLKNNSLEELFIIDEPNVFQYVTPQKWIKNVSCLIIITSVFSRNTMKYGERGYRHVLTESGALLQNLYLNSAALNINCCSVGSYIDTEINKLLDIDGLEESVVNVLLIGSS